jgi:hypothetical protein
MKPRSILSVSIAASSFLVVASGSAHAQRLPAPDPERGTIAVSIEAKPPIKIGKMPATQVYFARLDSGADPFAAIDVIPSSHSSRGQVYLLNAPPGRYVAVAALLEGVGGNASFQTMTFLSAATISQTEVAVVPGRITLMGRFKVQASLKIDEADAAQSHYYRLLSPGSAGRSGFARAMSGPVYLAELLEATKDSEGATAFWTEAAEKVFKREPVWAEAARREIDRPPVPLGTGPRGTVAEGRYTSPNDLFTVGIPKPSNFAGVPYSISEATADEVGEARQQDIVTFFVNDFGTYLVAGVLRVSADVAARLETDRRMGLRDLCSGAVRGWRLDLETLPAPAQESFVDTPLGEAVVAVYRVPKGSFLRAAQGRRPTADDRFDTNVACAAGRRGTVLVHVVAQNDSAPDDAGAVAQMAIDLFRDLRPTAP